MQKKKVLFVINSLECGGAEKSLVSLLSIFDYEKYEVYLQRFREGGMYESLLPKEVHVLPPLKYIQFCNTTLASQISSFNMRYLKVRFCIHVSLKKNKKKNEGFHDSQIYWKECHKVIELLPDEYDTAIAWGQGMPTYFVAEKIKARNKVAWINANYIEVGYNKGFDLKYYSEFRSIVCVSNVLAEIVKDVFPEFSKRVIVLYDINNEKLIQRMAEEHVDLACEEDCWRLVTVGRLVVQKGYDIATNAAYLLKQQKVKFHWYVIGDGPERGKIEQQIKEYDLSNCFHLLGSKSNPYPYMKSADIYVQTSKVEGFCLTLAEARILSIPCVTTEFDVVYSQMIQGENGLVVKMDAQAVAEGIQRLMNERELYAHIKEFQMKEKKGNCEEIKNVYRVIEDE